MKSKSTLDQKLKNKILQKENSDWKQVYLL